jgi:hypothetical protein
MAHDGGFFVEAVSELTDCHPFHRGVPATLADIRFTQMNHAASRLKCMSSSESNESPCFLVVDRFLLDESDALLLSPTSPAHYPNE